MKTEALQHAGIGGATAGACCTGHAPPVPVDPAEILPAEWVFGYGSLIWNPEFDHDDRALARVRGYHRAFCISSTRWRGTPEQPGVVLGLARGGSVTGMAFRLPEHGRTQALVRLYEREMPDRVYLPRLVRAQLDDGRDVRALTFVANPASPAYQWLHEDEIACRLGSCTGLRGPNHEYAVNTLHALQAMGVHDARLARLVRRLQVCVGEASVSAHRHPES